MAGTAYKEHDTTARGSDLLQLKIQHNGAITDLETLRQGRAAVAHNSGALAIHGAGSPLAKTASAVRYTAVVAGAEVYGLFAAADLPALSGTVNNATFNVFVFSVADNGTGTQTAHTRMGTAGATRAAVVFPTIPAGEVVFGYVEINPTGTGNFVGGTTNLDDATVVPNAAYVNFTGVPHLGSLATAAGLTASAIANAAGTVYTETMY